MGTWKNMSTHRKVLILILLVLGAAAAINVYWFERPKPLPIPNVPIEAPEDEHQDDVDEHKEMNLGATETVQSMFYFLKNGDIDGALSHFTVDYQSTFYKNEKKMNELKSYAAGFKEIRLIKLEESKRIIRMTVEIETSSDTEKHMIELRSTKPQQWGASDQANEEWVISSISNWP